MNSTSEGCKTEELKILLGYGNKKTENVSWEQITEWLIKLSRVCKFYFNSQDLVIPYKTVTWAKSQC